MDRGPVCSGDTWGPKNVALDGSQDNPQIRCGRRQKLLWSPGNCAKTTERIDVLLGPKKEASFFYPFA